MLPVLAPSGRLTAPHGSRIYAYCNHFTKQIIYSLSRTLDNTSSIAQLPFAGKKSVPRALRKDHWRPFFTVKFGSADQGLQAYQTLREWRTLREHNINSQQLVPPTELTPDMEDERQAEFERLEELGGERIGGPRTKLSTTKIQKMATIKQQRANSVADLALTLLRQEKRLPKLLADEEAEDRQLARQLGIWASNPAAAISNIGRSIQALSKNITVEKQKTGQLDRKVLARRIKQLNNRMGSLNAQMAEMEKFRYVVLPRMLNLLQAQATKDFEKIVMDELAGDDLRTTHWETLDVVVAHLTKDTNNVYIHPAEAVKQSHDITVQAHSKQVAQFESEQDTIQTQIRLLQNKAKSVKEALTTMAKASPGYQDLKMSLDSTYGRLRNQEIALEELQFLQDEIEQEHSRSSRELRSIELAARSRQMSDIGTGGQAMGAVQPDEATRVDLAPSRAAEHGSKDVKETQPMLKSTSISPLSASQILQQNDATGADFFTVLDPELQSILEDRWSAFSSALAKARTTFQARVLTGLGVQGVPCVFKTTVGGYGPTALSFDWRDVLAANKGFFKEYMPNTVSAPVRGPQSAAVTIEWSDDHDRLHASAWPDDVQHYQMGLAPRTAPDGTGPRVIDVSDAFDYDLDGTELGARPRAHELGPAKTPRRTRLRDPQVAKEQRQRLRKFLVQLKSTKRPDVVFKNKKGRLLRPERRLVYEKMARKQAQAASLMQSPLERRLKQKSEVASRVLDQLRRSARVAA